MEEKRSLLKFDETGKSVIGCDKSAVKVVIPKGVEEIGESAFGGCRVLASIEIPNSVSSIGRCAFSGCNALASIEIPNSVTSIGSGTFSGCDSLKVINVSKLNPAFVSIDGVLFNKDCSSIIKYPEAKSGKEYNIPNGVTSIGSSAFSGCKALTSIEIPNSVTSIGSHAFMNCM